MKNVNKLIELAASLLETPARQFRQGDKVVLKEGLGNLRFPKRGQIAIVTEVFSHPIYDTEKDAGSNCYRRPLDMKIAVFTTGGDLDEFHVDSRRFRLAEEVDLVDDTTPLTDFGRLLQAAANGIEPLEKEHQFEPGQWITPKLGPDAGKRAFLITEIDRSGDPVAVSLDDDRDIVRNGLRRQAMRPLALDEFLAMGGSVEEYHGAGSKLQ